MQILTYRNAGYPAIAVQTVEEDRLATRFLDTLTANQEKPPVFSIAATGGLRDLRQGRIVDPSSTYPKAFQDLTTKEDAILLVLDFHHVVKNPSAYRSLKLALPGIKANGSFVILVAPSWTLPPELEHDIPVLDFKLPTPEELSRALEVCVNDLRPLNPDIERLLTPERRQAALHAARGLILVQAENVFALAAQSAFDRAPIENEKLKLIKQTGYMQVSPPNPPDTVGGLLGIKEYFETEVIPAKDDPDLAVRGILLVGIPGTGKSLCARTAGAWLHWPVVRFGDRRSHRPLCPVARRNRKSHRRPCLLGRHRQRRHPRHGGDSAHLDAGIYGPGVGDGHLQRLPEAPRRVHPGWPLRRTLFRRSALGGRTVRDCHDPSASLCQQRARGIVCSTPHPPSPIAGPAWKSSNA